MPNSFADLCLEENERNEKKIINAWIELVKKIIEKNKEKFFEELLKGHQNITIDIETHKEAATFIGSVYPDENCVVLTGKLITSFATYTGIMSINKDSFLKESFLIDCLNMINVKVSCFLSRTIDRFIKYLPPSLWIGNYSIIDGFSVLNSGDFALSILNDDVICVIPKINDIKIIYKVSEQILKGLRKYKISTLLNLSQLQEIFATDDFIRKMSSSVCIDIYFSNKNLNSCLTSQMNYLDSLKLTLFHRRKILDEFYRKKNFEIEWSGEPGTTHVKDVCDFGPYRIPDYVVDEYWKYQCHQEQSIDYYFDCKGTIPSIVFVTVPYCECIYVEGLPLPWHGPSGMNFNEDFSRVSFQLNLVWKQKPEKEKLRCYNVGAKPILGQIPLQFRVSELNDLRKFEQQILRINNILSIHRPRQNPCETQQLKRCFTSSIIIDSECEIMFQIFYNLMFQRGTPRHLHTKNARYMISYLTNEKMKKLLLSRMNYIGVYIKVYKNHKLGDY